MPFQRHDAAAGAQVCSFLAALRFAEACQQQRIRAEPVLRGAVDHSSIIQNFRRMFHRQCAVSLPKNAGYFPAEFVHETKRGRLRSILCSASFAVDDQEWPPRVLWPCAAEKCFYNFAYDALLRSASYVFSQEGVILLYDTTKKDCCTGVQQSFLMRFQQKLLIIQQRLHQWGKHPRKHRNRCRNQRSQLQRRSRW